LNTSDRLHFSKYALDSHFKAYSDELDIFDFDDDLGRNHLVDENNFSEFADDLWEK
jgi:hypothetical protein